MLDFLKVLLIGDDEDIFSNVSKALEGRFQVFNARTNEEAEIQLNNQRFEVVIFDLFPEAGQSMELVRELYNEGSLEGKRVFILSCEPTFSQEIEGHRLGVDEYIKKPLNLHVFKAVVEKNILKLRGEAESLLKAGDLSISLPDLKVTICEDQEVDLTSKEFRILVSLVKNTGIVLTREQLYESGWGREGNVLQRTLDMHVSNLRRKLGNYGKYIKTIRSGGYKIEKLPNSGKSQDDIIES